MADLSDMWTDDAKEAIYDSVEKACQNNDGVFYEYPLCMTEKLPEISLHGLRHTSATLMISQNVDIRFRYL